MINTNHLLKVVSAWVSIVYVACYFGVAIYPPTRDLFFQYALHAKVSFVSDFLGIGYFLAGLVIWNVVAVAGFGLFAYLFNKIK